MSKADDSKRNGPAVSAQLTLGILLLTGLLAGRLASSVGLPRVVAYVLAGVLFSPGLGGDWLGVQGSSWSDELTNLSLGIIAFIVGGSITLEQLRRVGATIVTVAAAEALGAVLLVFLVFRWMLPGGDDQGWQLALALAVIASSTAPAATLAVLHQYRARGPLCNTLLGVVAIDDAIGLVLFSIMLAVTVGGSLSVTLGSAAVEIGGALLLGAFMGAVLASLSRIFTEDRLRLPLAIALILLVLGISEALGVAPLLAGISLGFVTRNRLAAGGERVLAPVELFEELVFLVFFTLAGAHFQVGVFARHLDWVLAYVIARGLGKVLGAAIGARAGGAPPAVGRWIGFGLLPQAGVAVGLALTLAQQPQFQGIGLEVINVILATTIMYEILGPFAVRFALRRAGELGEHRARPGR